MAIANWDSDYTFTASSGCVVDTIDLGTEKVYEFDILDGTGQALSTGTVGTGNKFHNHQVNGTLGVLDCDLLDAAAYNSFFLGRVIIFVETKNGQVLLFGADNGLTAETWEFNTGAADSDATGVSFSFTGAQPSGPRIIKDWATVKALMD